MKFPFCSISFIFGATISPTSSSAGCIFFAWMRIYCKVIYLFKANAGIFFFKMKIGRCGGRGVPLCLRNTRSCERYSLSCKRRAGAAPYPTREQSHRQSEEQCSTVHPVRSVSQRRSGSGRRSSAAPGLWLRGARRVYPMRAVGGSRGVPAAGGCDPSRSQSARLPLPRPFALHRFDGIARGLG